MSRKVRAATPLPTTLKAISPHPPDDLPPNLHLRWGDIRDFCPWLTRADTPMVVQFLLSEEIVKEMENEKRHALRVVRDGDKFSASLFAALDKASSSARRNLIELAAVLGMTAAGRIKLAEDNARRRESAPAPELAEHQRPFGG